MELLQAKARPQKPEASDPPSDVPKIPSIFCVDVADHLKEERKKVYANEQKPAAPLQPSPELQRVYDEAPHYFPGRRTDLAIDGKTVAEVEETWRQSVIQNKRMLNKAYNEHVLAPLMHPFHSKPRFSIEDYKRETI